MPYDRDRYEQDRHDRNRYERGAERDRSDRGAIERAGDEVRSWFGDDEARHRRERDERERQYGSERSYAGERSYGERNYRGERSFGDRDYGPERPWSERDRDRDRNLDRPVFQPYARGAQEFGAEGYGSTRSYGGARTYGREWRNAETWRVPGPFAGRGPKGYQRSDERIREDLSDRLTAHGLIDASDIEVRIQGGEVTLIGFVDSREAKRAAEDCAEDLPGVREVHNQLRIRSHADEVGVGRTSVLGLTEHETQTADTAKTLDAREANRSRTRNP